MLKQVEVLTPVARENRGHTLRRTVAGEMAQDPQCVNHGADAPDILGKDGLIHSLVRMPFFFD